MKKLILYKHFINPQYRSACFLYALSISSMITAQADNKRPVWAAQSQQSTHIVKLTIDFSAKTFTVLNPDHPAIAKHLNAQHFLSNQKLTVALWRPLALLTQRARKHSIIVLNHMI